MYKEALRPAWAEISLGALDYNIRQIMAKAGPSSIIGVIKADAYGHGALKVAEVLRRNGVNIFAVATLQEAAALREAGSREEIIILGLTPDIYAEALVKYDLTPVFCDSANAAVINDAAAAAGKTISGIVAVDTGMGRIGYPADDTDRAAEDLKRVLQLPNFRIKGMISHMSTADARDKTYSREQEAKYNRFYEAVTAAGVPIPWRSFANSASIMEIPSVLFEACRPGIILYGHYPSGEVDRSRLSLRPAMSVKADIVYLKEVPAGTSVSYGRRYISKKPARIATLGIGYADGYPRPWGPKATVLVNGCVCRIAGNICMDQCMVDVSEVPDVKVGDEVIIMGSDGRHSITAEDIAAGTGTICYEILCAFGQRLPKVYVK